MQFSDTLEIAIGLSFVFLLLSLIMTALQESVESLMKVRSKRLFQGFIELLNDPQRRDAAAGVVKVLYEHPLIHGLYRGDFETAKLKNHLPSYIPSRNFALALIDQVIAARVDPAPSHEASVSPAATPAERLRLAAERIQSEPLRRAVVQAVDLGAGDMEKIQTSLEAWFDSGRDRVSGWYRRQTHHFMFVTGLIAAVVLNINALMIADGLAQNATLRRAVAASAEREIKNYQSSPTPAEAATSPAPAPAPGTAEGAPPAPAPAAPSTADRGTIISSKAIAEIQNLGLPIGWGVAGRQSYIQAFDALDRSRPTDEFKIFGVGMVSIGLHLTMGLGWLMTALAVTLGAPFWFDILNRLVVIRATVKPHEKSREEGSQDHQDKKGVNVSLHAAPAAVIAPATGAAFDDHDPVVDQLNPADRPREGDEHDVAA